MQIISLEEYRKSKRIQEIPEKQENVESAKERLKTHLKKKLRPRLCERMRLEELKKKQSEPPTKKTPI